MGKLKYDRDLLDFVEDKRPVIWHVLRVLKFSGYVLALVFLYYVLFTLFFSSEGERRMMAESRLIEEEYDQLENQASLLEDAVRELGVKDENIYHELFNTNFSDLSFAPDTSSRSYDVSVTHARLGYMEKEMDALGRLVEEVTDSAMAMDSMQLRKIPSVLPIIDFPLGNVGASVGRKMHPFYKKVVHHGGLDLVAPAGVEVIATADGRVESVERAMKLQGTRVTIDHGNGYSTVYAHLSDILVRKGQKVSRGDVIARTGNSGTSFAPHLHYEVLKDGQELDPLCFFSGELDVDRYGLLLVYAVNTGQSLD